MDKFGTRTRGLSVAVVGLVVVLCASVGTEAAVTTRVVNPTLHFPDRTEWVVEVGVGNDVTRNMVKLAFLGMTSGAGAEYGSGRTTVDPQVKPGIYRAVLYVEYASGIPAPGFYGAQFNVTDGHGWSVVTHTWEVPPAFSCSPASMADIVEPGEGIHTVSFSCTGTPYFLFGTTPATHVFQWSVGGGDTVFARTAVPTLISRIPTLAASASLRMTVVPADPRHDTGYSYSFTGPNVVASLPPLADPVAYFDGVLTAASAALDNNQYGLVNLRLVNAIFRVSGGSFPSSTANRLFALEADLAARLGGPGTNIDDVLTFALWSIFSRRGFVTADTLDRLGAAVEAQTAMYARASTTFGTLLAGYESAVYKFVLLELQNLWEDDTSCARLADVAGKVRTWFDASLEASKPRNRQTSPFDFGLLLSEIPAFASQLTAESSIVSYQFPPYAAYESQLNVLEGDWLFVKVTSENTPVLAHPPTCINATHAPEDAPALPPVLSMEVLDPLSGSVVNIGNLNVATSPFRVVFDTDSSVVRPDGTLPLLCVQWDGSRWSSLTCMTTYNTTANTTECACSRIAAYTTLRSQLPTPGPKDSKDSNGLSTTAAVAVAVAASFCFLVAIALVARMAFRRKARSPPTTTTTTEGTGASTPSPRRISPRPSSPSLSAPGHSADHPASGKDSRCESGSGSWSSYSSAGTHDL